ncbi:hypothetical protein MARPU_02330 [Marichromatium purpuratum 984]|uniref:UPF0251 protein MARPU_02330 n=1 Tax=Marichromatium purpuratum 984 TaxID=765910 RepID=W0DZY4_MARPU|nr:hypothetical protein MARPU_02330 [Marichromatium purpuratum 984]
MPGRRRRVRRIGIDPGRICFKPCGRQGHTLETVMLRADEMEALRLCDLEGLYQEESARRMGISRTTLSRTIAQARAKVAGALLTGQRLVIQIPEHGEEQSQGISYSDNDQPRSVPGCAGQRDET